MSETTQATPTGRALARNLRAGLRVAFLLGTREADVVATWTQFAILILLSVLSTLLWQMLSGWPGYVNLWALPETLFFVPLLLVAAWSMAALGRRADETLPLVVAVMAAGLWIDAFAGVANLAAIPAPMKAWGPWVRWIVSYAAVGWFVACLVVAASRRIGLNWPARAAAALLAVAVVAYPLLSIGYDRTLWTKSYDESNETAGRADYDAAAREDVLYLQPRLLERDLARIMPREPGRPNLYLIGVAGYAEQDVFRREVDAVDALFAERFGTRGRSLRLVNNRATVRALPIATRTALAESLKRVGGLMDRDQDVLFLFLTSHGSKNGRFSLSFYPLRLSDLTAEELKQMLDDAGIRNRVIVVSSCYSGAFVDALRDDDTMVMTASSRDRNSFGCSNDADFTYFGKAYFDEALRATDSFSEAFDRAVPLIAAREKKDDYKPSQPQRYVGARIEAKLAAWREANAKVAVSTASAAPGGAQVDVYARFTRTWLRPDVGQDYYVECVRSADASSPESYWRRDPQYFGGIGPQSAQWSRIEGAWRRYVDAVCTPAEVQQSLERAYRDTYRRLLSERDMAKVMAFLDGPDGKRFASAEQAASRSAQDEAWARTRAESERALVEYQRAFAQMGIDLRPKPDDTKR